MDKDWLNYHRCWAARNPECIKRYRKASKLRKAETDSYVISLRERGTWMRWSSLKIPKLTSPNPTYPCRMVVEHPLTAPYYILLLALFF